MVNLNQGQPRLNDYANSTYEQHFEIPEGIDITNEVLAELGLDDK